jgi:small subunit ribosomal protein S2
VIASAVAEGLQARSGAGSDKPEVEGAEPLPEWEQELLASATAPGTPAADAETPTETTTEG